MRGEAGLDELSSHQDWGGVGWERRRDMRDMMVMGLSLLLLLLGTKLGKLLCPGCVLI